MGRVGKQARKDMAGSKEAVLGFRVSGGMGLGLLSIHMANWAGLGGPRSEVQPRGGMRCQTN